MGWAWSTTGSETITWATRVVALTWVHSGTGVKLPVAEIAAAIRSRAITLGIERPLFCLDSVHGCQLKEGLADLRGVRVVTPMDPALSSGIVCLAIDGAAIFELPAVLRERHGLTASVTPYSVPHLRLGPSILTSPDDVEAALRAIDEVR